MEDVRFEYEELIIGKVYEREFSGGLHMVDV